MRKMRSVKIFHHEGAEQYEINIERFPHPTKDYKDREKDSVFVDEGNEEKLVKVAKDVAREMKEDDS